MLNSDQVVEEEVEEGIVSNNELVRGNDKLFIDIFIAFRPAEAKQAFHRAWDSVQ